MTSDENDQEREELPSHTVQKRYSGFMGFSYSFVLGTTLALSLLRTSVMILPNDTINLNVNQTTIYIGIQWRFSNAKIMIIIYLLVIYETLLESLKVFI